jgi:hypothetical protein
VAVPMNAFSATYGSVYCCQPCIRSENRWSAAMLIAWLLLARPFPTSLNLQDIEQRLGMLRPFWRPLRSCLRQMRLSISSQDRRSKWQVGETSIVALAPFSRELTCYGYHPAAPCRRRPRLVTAE